MDRLRELVGLDNHYKFVATMSWAGGLFWFAWFALHGAPYTFLLAWGSLTMTLPYGLKGLTAWLNRRGASDEALSIASEAKAILDRRKEGGNEVEATD